MAHAQEHMAFRGCAGMTADQTAAIYAQLGRPEQRRHAAEHHPVLCHGPGGGYRRCASSAGRLPSRHRRLAGRVVAGTRRYRTGSCARPLQPTYKFIDRLNQDMFAGTPYAHDPLGTKHSFDATTGDMLKDFYNKWYTPSNAILVIVGDVDPTATMARIRQLFGDIASHPLPSRPEVDLQPVKSETFTLDSNLPYLLGFISYRFPGTSSPDYAASQILSMCWPASVPISMEWFRQARRWAAEFGMAGDLSQGQRCLWPGGAACRSRWRRRDQGDAGHTGKLCPERRPR